MAELTQEEKNDLREWANKRKLYFLIFIVWAFALMPLIYYLAYKIFELDDSTKGIFSKVMTLVVFVVFFLDLRYRKKCPKCKSKIGELTLLITLPGKCEKCGVLFR